MGNKKRKFADDGWALWIDGDDKSTMYLNEWINPKGKNYVDVGIRIHGARETTAVNLFVPFEITREEICDLSYMLADDGILCALFNTSGRVDMEKTKFTSELRYDGKSVSLISFSEDLLSTKNASYGTVITMDFELIRDYITSSQAYLIFRIPHKTLDKIFTPSIDAKSLAKKINLLIQSPILSEKYGYSIRINEARLLPPEINGIKTLQDQRIRKALVTISLSDEYEMNDSTCYRIRRLEADLNREYAPEGYDCSDAITYQWVEERDVNMKAHYNFYFTMVHNKISKLSMFFYLCLAVTIGVADAVLYDLMKWAIGLL